MAAEKVAAKKWLQEKVTEKVAAVEIVGKVKSEIEKQGRRSRKKKEGGQHCEGRRGTEEFSLRVLRKRSLSQRRLVGKEAFRYDHHPFTSLVNI